MNNSIKYILASLLFPLLVCFGGTVQAQQLPKYSQYMFNMLNINPAYAGHREIGSVNALFRNQWVGFPGAPVTGSISFDQRLNKKNGSLGAQFYYDKIGIELTTGLQGFYSYAASFNNSTLFLGMSMGLMNYSMNYTRTNAYDPGDPQLMQNFSGILPTAGFGALWSGKKWYAGLSMPALFKTKLYTREQPKLQGAGEDGHFFFNTGVFFNVDKEVVIKPSLLVKAVQGAPIQADINCNLWIHEVFGVGASYRTNNSIVGLMEVQLRPQVRLGYAYDYNTTNLVNYNRGTHELMLRFDFTEQDKKVDYRYASQKYY